MATMPDPAPIEELPAIADVDAADNKIGSFMSDLDWIKSAVKRMAGDVISLEDAARLIKAGEPLPTGPRVHVDPAAFARLLVFADEITRDAEGIQEDADQLRFSLLSLYRENVIEGSGA